MKLCYELKMEVFTMGQVLSFNPSNIAFQKLRKLGYIDGHGRITIERKGRFSEFISRCVEDKFSVLTSKGNTSIDVAILLDSLQEATKKRDILEIKMKSIVKEINRIRAIKEEKQLKKQVEVVML